MKRSSAEKALEISIFFALLIHIVALFTMAVLLLPGIPGVGLATVDLRAAFLAMHPWRWHLGWLPWHLCAVSDLAISVALLRMKQVPKALSIPTLLLTLLAFGIEQYFEIFWDVRGPHVAADIRIAYGGFEHTVAVPVSFVAASIYAVMAMGWSWCLSCLSTWTKWLKWLSIVTWTILLFAAAAPLLPNGYRLPERLTNLSNQLGFVLMVAWFALALEAVLRLTRLNEPYGRMAIWRSAHTSVIGRGLDLLANSRALKYTFEFLPTIALHSDVQDVVYVNYLASADRLQALLPDELRLQRLDPDQSLAMFTVLTYRHNHFGPRIRSLRSLMPSPLQSNWRVYVKDATTGLEGVYFVSTCLSSTPFALLARILSEGVSMHVPEVMRLDSRTDGSFQIDLDPGTGSAPDLHASLSLANTPALSGDWKRCFGNFEGLLHYCVPQQQALSVQPWYGYTTAQRIRLTGPLSAIRPLQGQVSSAVLQQILGHGEPVCFVLPHAEFHYDGTAAASPNE